MLQFENLTLRKAQVEDALQLVSWWNDGEVMAHAGYPNGIGVPIEKVVALIKKDSDTTCHFIMDINDIPVGEMHYRKKEDFCAEIGIKICNSAFHNKGYGKKFLSLLINDLFATHLYKIVQVNVAKKNDIALAVYEKLGFKPISDSACVSKKYKNRKTGSIRYELNESDFINFLK